MRSYYGVLALCVAFASAPAHVSAKVLISEVAWMGTDDNVNAEWIELYNDGAEQDLTGWTLVATDDQPNITLTGSIVANGYALLERTSDDTLPSNTALVVYTGALGNAGETLELRDTSGAVVDRVAGGENWELGGDNATKDTLQRSGEPATGGWVTAPATPGRGGGVRAPERTVDDAGDVADDADDTESTVAAVTTPKEVRVFREPALTLDLGPERTVTIGVPTAFIARAYKESNKEIVANDVDWNFGDGTTAHGREVTHTYLYTGDYVVHAKGNRTGFLREITDSTQIVVHVVEPSFSIREANEKYIEVHNSAPHTLDLSGFALAVGTNHFRVPHGTVLLPESSVRFPKQVTKLAVREGSTAGIFYPDDVLALTYRRVASVATSMPSTQVARFATASATEYDASPTRATAPVTSIDPSPEKEEEGSFIADLFPLDLDRAPVAQAQTGLAESGLTDSAGEGGNRSLVWWLVGLLGALLTAVTVVLLVRHEQAEVVKGYEIEE